MDKPNKKPMDFFNDAIKKVERAQRIEALKAMREIYLDMRESGFKMWEAMSLIAAVILHAQKDGEEE